MGLVVASLALAAAACAGSSGEPSGASGPAAGASGSSASSTGPPTTAVRTPGTTVPVATAACGPAAAGLTRSAHVARTVDVDGDERQVKEYLPASYGTEPMPVVIQLHGYLSGADGQIAMSAIEPLAESAGFVVLTPQGSGDLPYWNAVPHADLPDDLGFVRTLIDDVTAHRCVDPSRVYVVGMSNGAFLTSLVACRLADRVAAVAAVAGLQTPKGCDPSRAVPVLAIHGTGDTFVPADGTRGPALDTLAWDHASTRAFDGLPWTPVRTAVADRARLAGCDLTPATSTPWPAITELRYGSCGEGADVELLEVAGGGHTWPGSRFSQASAAILGATTTEVDGDQVIWDFLRQHRLG
ncbi:MAG: PHB depolymerase family esterase [Acidimicrobiales bacterium]